MIVADRLGVDPDDVEVLHSDTDVSPFGLDTYGSRSLVGRRHRAVAWRPRRSLDKARTIAAHQMEAAEDDLEFAGGRFSVRGTPDRGMTIQEVAFGAFTAHDLPDGMEPILDGQVTWDPPNFTFPFGTHVAVVEVDEETGKVELRRLRRGRRLRQPGQPAHRRGPGPRRHRAGRRPGAVGGGGLRRRRARCAARRSPTTSSPRRPSCRRSRSATTVDAEPDEPDGREGHRRGGHDRLGAGGDQRRSSTRSSPLGITDVEMPASPERVWSAIQSAKEAQS